MQFSDATNKLGIVQMVDWQCNTNATSFPLADKTRQANKWYYKVVSWIWHASGTWEFDDSNISTLPIATTDLVADQQDYQLPTTAFKLLRVEVKDASGNFHVLRQIDQTQIRTGLTEFHETSGLPQLYDVIGNSLLLYPKPASSAVTTTDGLKVLVARDIDEFAAADTTQEPGFDRKYHEIIPLGISYDFFVKNSISDKADRIRQEIDDLRLALFEHYGDKNRDAPTKIQRKVESFV